MVLSLCMNNSIWIDMFLHINESSAGTALQCLCEWYGRKLTKCVWVDHCGCVFCWWAVSDGLDLSTIRFQSLGESRRVDRGSKRDKKNTPPSPPKTGMAFMSLAWCLGAAFALFCGSSWPQAHSALAPENEVPLRPTTWLPEGKITSVTLPKGQTRR